MLVWQKEVMTRCWDGDVKVLEGVVLWPSQAFRLLRGHWLHCFLSINVNPDQKQVIVVVVVVVVPSTLPVDSVSP